MATHTIHIRVENDKLVYWDQWGDPARVKHAWYQDHVRWESKKDQEFTVDFGKNWPFAGNPVVLTSVGGETLRQQVVAQAPEPTHYKYTVRMLPNGPEEDPEIIIDPSGD